MKAKKLFYKDCHLAGRKYHDADEVWDKLHIGLELELVRDYDNQYDVDAVAVVYTDYESEDCEEYLLGYIPSDENTEIAHFFEMGWDQLFECRITKINPDAHPENQIHLTIRIKRNVRQPVLPPMPKEPDVYPRNVI